MTVQKADVQLVMTAAAVARFSPRAWSEFLAEFRKYTDRVKDSCVMSPPETLQVAQGRARESAATLDMLEKCMTEADKLAGSKK